MHYQEIEIFLGLNILEHLAKFLQLETINKIEGFDISHTRKNVSASCVSITRGPNKKNYRIMN